MNGTSCYSDLSGYAAIRAKGNVTVVSTADESSLTCTGNALEAGGTAKSSVGILLETAGSTLTVGGSGSKSLTLRANGGTAVWDEGYTSCGIRINNGSLTVNSSTVQSTAGIPDGQTGAAPSAYAVDCGTGTVSLFNGSLTLEGLRAANVGQDFHFGTSHWYRWRTADTVTGSYGAWNVSNALTDPSNPSSYNEYHGHGETAKLNIEPSPLEFVEQPVSVTAAAYNDVSFTARASLDDSLLTYQWQSSTDGGTTWANIAEEQNPTRDEAVLQLNGVILPQSGSSYRCTVTRRDNTAAIISNVAALTVEGAKPTIGLSYYYPDSDMTTEPVFNATLYNGSNVAVDAEGTIDIRVTDKNGTSVGQFSERPVNGRVTVSFEAVAYKEYQVSAEYKGDGKKYTEASSVTMSYMARKTTCRFDHLTVGKSTYPEKSVTVRAALENSEATGTFVFRLVNTDTGELIEESITLASGTSEYTHTFTNLNDGRYELRARYSGDNQFNPVERWVQDIIVGLLIEVTPAEKEIMQGGSQAFNAEVQGVDNTAVTWSITGGSLSSITENGLLTVGEDEPVGTVITVTATSAANPAKSASATVTVKIKKPTVTDPAEDQTVIVPVGETAKLSVTAKHAESYQWYINRGNGKFEPIDDATDASYESAAVTPENNGYQYYCIVSNSTGKVESPVFTLQVVENEEIPPTGDDTPLHLTALLMGAGLLGFAVLRKKEEDAA